MPRHLNKPCGAKVKSQVGSDTSVGKTSVKKRTGGEGKVIRTWRAPAGSALAMRFPHLAAEG